MKRAAKNIGILLVCIFYLSVLNASSSSAFESNLNCGAAFTYHSYQGTTPSNTGITFINLSLGDALTYAWDFGDGNFSSEGAVSLDHFYLSEGLFSVCLTVWDDQGCTDTFCGEVVVGDLVDVCNIADCVLPGDANKDGEANFYDLLELGVGYGTIGQVRPNATNDWMGQIAPDWIESTPDGVNFKHLDCDGNGIINEDDLMVINGNYTSMTADNPTAESSAPLIHIEFDQDTIYVGDAMTSNIEVVAHLNIGTADLPAQDIYGLALYLSYPEDLVVEDSVSFEYENNSFFGAEEEVLWMPNNQSASSQVDVGITRIDQIAVGGFGEIGKGVFIVNSDILVGRTSSGDVPFPILIHGVKMIDSLGNELPVNLNSEPATLIFSKSTNTNVDDSGIAEAISVFPNPTSESILVNTSYLDATDVEVFDSFGRSMLKKDIRSNRTQLDSGNWDKGIYFIKVNTGKGAVTKRVMKQ